MNIKWQPYSGNIGAVTVAQWSSLFPESYHSYTAFFCCRTWFFKISNTATWRYLLPPKAYETLKSTAQAITHLPKNVCTCISNAFLVIIIDLVIRI